MKYFSMFTGIGGFELGMPKNWKCVGYSEINQYAIQIYEQHFRHKNYGNATEIRANELPDFDFLCGGFPCQSFSIAGKRGGFNDTRGTLFFDIARIIKEKRPQYFLLENVKGLLSHDEGRTFKTILSTLTELQYDLQTMVLNSKDFGVPQNRERIFIVGHLRTKPRPEVFSFGRNDTQDTRKLGKEVSYMIDANYFKGVNSGSQGGKSSFDKLKRQVIVSGYLSSPKWDKFHESSRRLYDRFGIAPTLPTSAGGGHLPKIYDLKSSGSKTRRGIVKEGYTGALDESCYQSVNGIRRLTPVECERLQGFPDNWTGGVSDTQRYKCLGNAVTVNVIRAIMENFISGEFYET